MHNEWGIYKNQPRRPGRNITIFFFGLRSLGSNHIVVGPWCRCLNTILFSASGHLEAITLLLDHDADVSIRTQEAKDAVTREVIGGGRTCLDEAVLKRNERVTDLLLSHKK